MSSVVDRLTNRGLIKPPKFIKSNIHYEVMMGSEAYGVSSGSSDVDIYGFCIPPKDVIFPHLIGYIPGFGSPPNRFDQYQKHHVFDANARNNSGVEYDFAIFNIVKYFHLVMNNNPNMIDSLFVPNRCILHITKVGGMVREYRKMFLHKGSWVKFKSYSYSQLKKARNKINCIELKNIWNFEETKNIERLITFNDVLDEMKERKLNEEDV